jgi:kumamolisin
MANSQDRIELKGSTRAALPGARDVGPADAHEQIEVTVLLRRRSKPESFPSVEQEAARLPRERKYLTRKQFEKSHGASLTDLRTIRAFARQHGLQIVSVDRGRRIVKLGGTVQAFNTAFGADLRRYEHESGTYRCRTGPLTHPKMRFGLRTMILRQAIASSLMANSRSSAAPVRLLHCGRDCSHSSISRSGKTSVM